MSGIDRLKELAESLSVHFDENEPMSQHTSFAIGGPADLYLSPASPETLPELLAACREYDVPVLILGNGTNLLVSDLGVAGAVIRTGGVYAGTRLNAACEIECGSGVKLSALCMAALENSLTGLEFAWGIPGTAGGATYMNAGAYDGEMKDVVISCAHLTPEGDEGGFDGGALAFGYRQSAYHENGCLITGVRVLLKPGNANEIRAKMDHFMNLRKEKQPIDMPSAGSVFKRPHGNFAGTLIEQCGLKGLTVGGAAVSEKHAGFIVNTGGATCADVLTLIEKIQSEVFLQTSIRLECEIKRIGR